MFLKIILGIVAVIVAIVVISVAAKHSDDIKVEDRGAPAATMLVHSH